VGAISLAPKGNIRPEQNVVKGVLSDFPKIAKKRQNMTKDDGYLVRF
jgi:hypothetical protein